MANNISIMTTLVTAKVKSRLVAIYAPVGNEK